MEIGNFEKIIENKEIEQIASSILKEDIKQISRICEQWGENEDEVREYNVYIITTASKKAILKKTEKIESDIYTNYLSKGDFNVPHLYGSLKKDDDNWICIEMIEGDDLRDMTDEIALSAAKTLGSIQEFFWTDDLECTTEDEVKGRFIKYWQRVLRRAQFLADKPVLRKAY